MVQLILSSNEDDIYELVFDSLKQSIRSIASVKAVRQQIHDLLVLRSDYSLYITTFEGVDMDIDIEIQSNTTLSSPTDISMCSYEGMSITPTAVKPRIVAIKDCVVSNVTFELEGGESIRASLNLMPSDPLVGSMKVVLTSNLKHDHFPKIWGHFLQL